VNEPSTPSTRVNGRGYPRCRYTRPVRLGLPVAMIVLFGASALAQENGTRIDLLIVYTPAAREDVGSRETIETALAERVVDMNTALWSSGVNTRLRLVHVAEVDYGEPPSEQTRHHLRLPDDGYLDDVHDLRDEYAADLVALIVDRRWDGCGEAERSGLWPTDNSPYTLSKTYCGGDRFVPGSSRRWSTSSATAWGCRTTATRKSTSVASR